MVFCPPNGQFFSPAHPPLSQFKSHGDFLPREANFTHMCLTFIPSNSPHMFVKTCMLCALSGPICSHAFSPMSPALPGGLCPSLTLFIQSEQLGPSQPKQWGVRGQGDGWRTYLAKFRFNQALELSFCSPSLALLSSDALPRESKGLWGRVVSRSGQLDCWM